MKRKIIFVITIVLFIMISFFFSENRKEIMNKDLQERVEARQEENSIKESTLTISSEVKLSYDANIIINKHYRDCNHTISNGFTVPKELVNKTEKEIEKEYSGWEILEFGENKLSMYKEFDGICDEHYIVSCKDGLIVVYTIDEKKKKSLYEVTDIPIEYLPEEDVLELKSGIEVSEISNLNALLENYE